jgi:hypothetical protein
MEPLVIISNYGRSNNNNSIVSYSVTLTNTHLGGIASSQTYCNNYAISCMCVASSQTGRGVVYLQFRKC